MNFVFSLVQELGGMTVAEFLNKVSSTELTYWIARSRIERAKIESEAQAKQYLADLKRKEE